MVESVPRVKIVTDSTAYLTPEVIERFGIHIVPLKVAFGAEVFDEGVNIANDEFYQRVAEGTVFPTTSQPSSGEFVRVYSELARRGHPILSIHISSKLSGTVESAVAARNMLPEARIEIVEALSIATGMMIAPAAEAAERGEELSSVREATERMNRCIKVVGSFDTLEYLWKGGRIGAARALLAILLRIKPVLSFYDGEVRVLAKPRTMNRAMDYMLNFADKRIRESKSLHGWIAHARSAEEAAALEAGLRSHFDWAELRLFELGPVLGTHLGPGFVGVGFYCDEDWQQG